MTASINSSQPTGHTVFTFVSFLFCPRWKFNAVCVRIRKWGSNVSMLILSSGAKCKLAHMPSFHLWIRIERVNLFVVKQYCSAFLLHLDRVQVKEKARGESLISHCWLFIPVSAAATTTLKRKKRWMGTTVLHVSKTVCNKVTLHWLCLFNTQ